MSVKDYAEKAVPKSSPAWISRFARIGLVSKGIVYVLLGLLSAMAAFGLGGQKTDKQQTVSFLHDQPFGKVILVVIALGLFCYTAWRLLQAFQDTENKGTDAKALFVRARYGFSGLGYAALAFFAIKMAINGDNGSNGDSSSRQTFIAKILDLPFGQWLVGIVAIGFIAAGIYQFYKAFSGKYKKKVNYEDLNNAQKTTMDRAGFIGYCARGIVWLVLGYFMFRAAMHNKGAEAQGTKAVFDFLQNTGGAMLMGVVALGLVAYGAYMFVRARYERVGKS